MHTIQQRCFRVLSAETGFEPAAILVTHKLVDDLNCDSLDCKAIALGMEEEFGIELDDDQFAQLETVQQVVEYVIGVCAETTINDLVPGDAISFSGRPVCEMPCANEAVRRLAQAASKVTIELDWAKTAIDPFVAKKRHADLKQLSELVDECNQALKPFNQFLSGVEENLEHSLCLAASKCTAGQA